MHSKTLELATVLFYRYSNIVSLARKIAYKGAAFTIEWYFDQHGKSEALDYYTELSIERRVKVMKLFKLMGEIGKIFDTTKFRNEGDQIFAFKPQPDRFLCFFFVGKKIIVTNGFEKKSQKLPPGEKDRALRAKLDYEQRTIRGALYEKD